MFVFSYLRFRSKGNNKFKSSSFYRFMTAFQTTLYFQVEKMYEISIVITRLLWTFPRRVKRKDNLNFEYISTHRLEKGRRYYSIKITISIFGHVFKIGGDYHFIYSLLLLFLSFFLLPPPKIVRMQILLSNLY